MKQEHKPKKLILNQETLKNLNDLQTYAGATRERATWRPSCATACNTCTTCTAIDCVRIAGQTWVL